MGGRKPTLCRHCTPVLNFGYTLARLIRRLIARMYFFR
jgi:hypothetical protein